MSARRPDRRPGLRGLSLSPRAALLVAAALACAVPIGCLAGWRWLRDSGTFAVQHVVVRGADPRLAADVRAVVVRAVGGRSLLAVSPGTLASAVEAIPAVRHASVDRSFPSSLHVRVVEEHPFAVARAGAERLVLSPTGRMLRVVPAGRSGPSLPVLWLTSRPAVAAGGRLRGPGVVDRLAALRAVPAGFGGRVARAEIDRHGGISLRLQSNLEIRLGPALNLDQKLKVARVLLHRYATPADRSGLRYMDVSAGTHAVVCPSGGDPATRDIPQDSPDAPLVPTDQLTGAALDSACLQASAAASASSTGTTTDALSTTAASSTSTSLGGASSTTP